MAVTDILPPLRSPGRRLRAQSCEQVASTAIPSCHHDWCLPLLCSHLNTATVPFGKLSRPARLAAHGTLSAFLRRPARLGAPTLTLATGTVRVLAFLQTGLRAPGWGPGFFSSYILRA